MENFSFLVKISIVFLSAVPVAGRSLAGQASQRVSPRYKVSPMVEENVSIRYHLIEMLLAPVDEGSDGGHQ